VHFSHIDSIGFCVIVPVVFFLDVSHADVVVSVKILSFLSTCTPGRVTIDR